MSVIQLLLPRWLFQCAVDWAEWRPAIADGSPAPRGAEARWETAAARVSEASSGAEPGESPRIARIGAEMGADVLRGFVRLLVISIISSISSGQGQKSNRMILFSTLKTNFIFLSGLIFFDDE